jgi:hypothetical protein
MAADPPLRERLAQSLGPVLASDLAAHLRRDGVLVVAAGLDLLTCAEALATDDASRVREWVTAGSLRKASEGERAQWPGEADGTWMAVVVQPFVLVQRLNGAEA